MMAPMTTFDAIGLFDENLFAYFEDVDLCLRAKKAGFHLACVPQSVVWHKGSASTRRSLAQGTTSPLKHYLIARNRMLIIERYAPPRSRWFHFVIINPLRTAYYIAAFVARRRWTKLRWFWRGVRDGVHGDLEMRSDFASIT
jgi:GT2 family glycosyltransferase